MKLYLLPLLILVPSIATAEPSITTSAAKPERFAVGLVAGLFTPIGEGGLALTYVPTTHLELSGGVGYSLVMARGGVQGALMPRYRQPIGPVTLTAGIGVSAGDYNPCSPFADPCMNEKALWGDAEIGAEASYHGVFGRLFGGVRTIVAHDGDPMRDRPFDGGLPYLGLTVGYKF